MANFNSIYTGPQIDSAVGLGLTSLQSADIANFETTTELNSRDTANRDRTNHTGTQAASTITGLATIATTGAYSDLIGAPDLSTFDDVLLYANLAAFPVSGELGKVYVAEDSGYIYRWDGSAYVQLTDQTAIWGQIGGTLSNQTDLQNALNTKLESTDIADFETTTELNSRDTANRARANHTGTQLASTISNFDSAVDARVVPSGADTQIQFNDGGVFAGDSDFTYNKTTNELSLAGDIKLDDGSTFETIVQSIPATANQVISFPDATGIVALTSDLTSKVSSDPTGVTGADQITNMFSLTQAEYDAITPNASTFYVIVG